MESSLQLVGTVLDGKYEISGVLGRGGMGTVYIAKQIDLNREVVIKVLNEEVPDVDDLERFKREASILASLEHKNLLRIYQYGLIANELPYLVLEKLNGQTLADEISAQGKLPWQRVIAIGMQISDAMEYAHTKGVLHRDLKPENIILETQAGSEFVKIIDFGLARLLVGPGSKTLTATGTLLGSPHYMSPEMCSGLRADPRSEVYSLACLLYHCLAGVPPFEADNAIALIYKHQNDFPERLDSSIPEHLNAALFKALEKKPESRFQSMKEFSEALDNVKEGRTPTFDLSKVSGLKSAREKNTRSKSTLILGSVAICALLLCTTLFILKNLSVTTTKNAEKGWGQSEKERRNLANSVKLMMAAERDFSDGNTKKALAQGSKALKLLMDVLISTRNMDALVKEELNTISKFEAIIDKYPDLSRNPDWLDIFRISGNQEKLAHWHNYALLSLLQASIFKQNNPYQGVRSYCAASESFSKNFEIEMAETCLHKAENLMKEKVARNGPHACSTSILLARSLLMSKSKREALADKLLEAAEKIHPKITGDLRTELELAIADRYIEKKQIEKAALHLQIARKHSSEIYLDSVLRRQAGIAESNHQYAEAIDLYSQLANSAAKDGHLASASGYQKTIARLEEKLAESK